jgi:hypothetical protein
MIPAGARPERLPSGGFRERNEGHDMIRRLAVLAFFAAPLCLPCGVLAQDNHNNFFASVMVDGSKIGQVHFSALHNDQGDLEELRTKVSFSVFGIKLYDFNQQLHEQWKGNTVASVNGTTDDNGTRTAVMVERTPTDFAATLNTKPSTLPLEAFPMSFWHYDITRQTLLFDPADLSLMTVAVARHDDTVKRGKETLPAERFDFTGAWKGSVWYDTGKQFLQAKYESNGRQVTVLMDPD